MVHGYVLVFALALGATVLACSGPSLDVPQGLGSVVRLDLEPAAELASLPAVFRARLGGAASLPGALPFLFEGELSEYHQRGLARGELSGPLRERALPLHFWTEADALVVQPQTFLNAGGSYTLALTGYGELGRLTVQSAATPRWERVFPRQPEPARSVAVYCGASGTVAARRLDLQPGSVPVTLAPGVLGAEVEGCFTLAAPALPAGYLLPPPEVAGAAVDPSPFVGSNDDAPPRVEVACSHVRLGHACAEVLDDRVRIEPFGEELLWVLSGDFPQLVVSRHDAAVVLKGGLTPEEPFTLAGFSVSVDGERRDFSEDLRTGPARRHVVLNEVLANPTGREPDSEWIELVNDSARAVSLLGLHLEDVGGSVALPDAVLQAGEFVLLHSPAFRASGLDVAIPAGVRRLELASLGERGLSNAGESLLLVGREGIVSRFPLVPAKRAGISIARREAPAADDDATAFAEHAAPGASPGGPNALEGTR